MKQVESVWWCKHLHQQDGVVVHRRGILHLHRSSLKPLHCTHNVFWDSILSPVKHYSQASLKIVVFVSLKTASGTDHRGEIKVGLNSFPAFHASAGGGGPLFEWFIFTRGSTRSFVHYITRTWASMSPLSAWNFRYWKTSLVSCVRLSKSSGLFR